jgi:hypothetical protein
MGAVDSFALRLSPDHTSPSTRQTLAAGFEDFIELLPIDADLETQPDSGQDALSHQFTNTRRLHSEHRRNLINRQ